MGNQINVHKNSDYTILNNTFLRDKNLSLRSKGLIACMFSLPEGWSYSERGLSMIAKDGRESVHTALQDLEAQHYLIRSQSRSGKGTFGAQVYDLYDSPYGEEDDGDCRQIINQGNYRIHRRKDFTIVSNHHFKNKQLSYRAKGLMTVICGLPKDWDFSEKGLAALSADGITSLRAAMKELTAQGYIVRTAIHDPETGRIMDTIYDIYEEPVSIDGHKEAKVNHTVGRTGAACEPEEMELEALNIKCSHPWQGLPKTVTPKTVAPKAVTPKAATPKVEQPDSVNQKQYITYKIKDLPDQERNQSIRSAEAFAKQPLDMRSATAARLGLTDLITSYPDLEELIESCAKLIDSVLAESRTIMYNGEAVRPDEVASALQSLSGEDIVEVAAACSGMDIHDTGKYLLSALYSKGIRGKRKGEHTRQGRTRRQALDKYLNIQSREYDFNTLEDLWTAASLKEKDP